MNVIHDISGEVEKLST